MRSVLSSAAVATAQLAPLKQFRGLRSTEYTQHGRPRGALCRSNRYSGCTVAVVLLLLCAGGTSRHLNLQHMCRAVLPLVLCDGCCTISAAAGCTVCLSCSPFSASQKANWDELVRFNKTAQASIYYAPEPYKSIILKQQPPPGEHNARVSK
jgi:hypothetical protein